MAMSFQQQSRRRKFIYAGVIVLLFTGMLFHRKQVVEVSAKENSLSETNIGSVDLGGSAARFALASFRGPLVCVLWWESLELKENHEWEKYKLRIRAITKLQPHFKRPWLYLGWDLAYNVAVEFDGIDDKYYHVAEGFGVLVEGEQTTRWTVYDKQSKQTIVVGDPDMRWEIGYTLMNKMTMSDEKRTFRCFLPISCISPEQRDPLALRANPDRLRQFKNSYKQFVARIKDLRHVPEGAEAQLDFEIVEFLRLYRNIPSRYEWQSSGQGAVTDVRPSAKPFPIWPRETDPGHEHRRSNTHLEGEQDPHEIAYHWAAFAEECLPPPTRDQKPKEREKSRLYRMPTSNLYIFRGHPARYKSLKAMAYAKDGLFEESKQAWEEAYDRWQRFAMENGLVFAPEQKADLEKRAALHRTTYPELKDSAQPPPASDLRENAQLRDSYEAHLQLFWQGLHRGTSHFNHWEIVSTVYRTDKAVAAWQRFYEGSTKYRSDPLLARAAYDKGIDLWIDLLTEPLHPQRDVAAFLGLASEGGFPVAMTFWSELAGRPLIVPHRNFVGLLALGPGPSYPAPLFAPATRSTLGKDTQVQREVVELQQDYMAVFAKCESPKWVKAGGLFWDLTQPLAGYLSAPLMPNPLRGINPVGFRPPLEYYESVLEEMTGPFDPYVDPGRRQSVSKQTRGIGGIYQMSRSDPVGAQVGTQQGQPTPVKPGPTPVKPP
jgi:hypothetical protein